MVGGELSCTLFLPGMLWCRQGVMRPPSCTASPGKAVLEGLDAWLLPPRMVHMDDELTL